MADYTKQIFELLGVEPEEEFRIGGPHAISKDIFKYNKNFELYYKENNKWFSAVGKSFHNEKSIFKILRGEQKIVKIPHPTAEEQLAIDYARACGYKWLAKDEGDDCVYAYTQKPKFNETTKCWECIGDYGMPIEIPISFIRREDEEPFYIGVE